MSIRIPVIVDYNGKELQRLRREFAQVEGVAAKMKLGIQKAALPAAAAITALAGASISAVNAALQDAQAASELARTLRAVTKATDPAIKATEDWITQQGRLFGVTDDNLRPALAKLVRVTKDVSKAQRIAALGMDLAAATGKDLGSVTDALSKAYAGNMKSLKALAPELTPLIKDGAKVDEVFANLAKNFGGAAQRNAETTAGRLAILKVRFSEMFEQIGYALLPAFEKLMPYFEKLATWLENNPDKVAAIAAQFGNFAKAIIDTGLKIGQWASVVKNVFVDVYNFIVDILNKLIDLADKSLGPFINLGEIGKIDKGPSAPKPTPQQELEKKLAGYYLPPGVAGPIIGNKRSIPTPDYTFPGEGRFTPRQSVNNITINVSGGDPRAVVDKIVQWSRQNSALPSSIRLAQ